MRINSATASAGCVSLSWIATWSGRVDQRRRRSFAKAGQDVLQRAADQEVLLQEAQRPAGLGRIVRVEHAGERFGGDVVDHGADEVALRELGEVEATRAPRLPTAAAC